MLNLFKIPIPGLSFFISEVISERVFICHFIIVTIISFLFRRQAWDDTRLAWNSADYGGVTEVYLTPTSIWVPPIMLDNA